MNSIQLELNEKEANALLELLDIATKAGGLRAAPNALAFVKKIQDQAQAQPAPAKEPEPPGEN